MDWEYALGLELTDPGFDFSVLSQFRDRLGADDRAMVLLETMLARASGAGLLRARGRVRTGSTPVLARIRALNRLEKIGQALRLALEEIARVAPGWLMSRIPVHFQARYPRRIESARPPKGRRPGRRGVSGPSPRGRGCWTRSAPTRTTPGWPG